MKRVHLFISGDVQGVGYRQWALKNARACHLVGWVKNRSDGSVEIIAEGEENALHAFSSLCGRGPDTGWVSHVESKKLEATGEFSSFEVAR